MKPCQLTIAALIGLICVPVHADAIMSTNLSILTVFAGSSPAFEAGYITTGARSTIYGNFLAGDVSTVGASGSVTGNATTVNAATIGGYFDASYSGSKVGGNICSGGVATAGDSANIGGDLTSSGAASVGANGTTSGSLTSGGVGSLGASGVIGGNFVLLNAAGSAGANAKIGGDMSAAGLLSAAIDALVGGSTASGGGFSATTPGLKLTLSLAPSSAALDAVRHDVQQESQDVKNAQAALSAMVNSTGNMGSDANNSNITSQLELTITANTTLNAGVYSGSSLSTTAGQILLLDAKGLDNQTWVFNILDILVFGGNTTTQIINAGKNNNVFWNVSNGYATVGAGALLTGNVLAKTYISVGANAVVMGTNGTCVGLYSQNSYVSAGDSAQIGSAGCGVDVPEPPTYTMLIAGLGLLAFAAHRKSRAHLR